ncbi:MAG: hypothetical protein KatS3mg031_0199 [Chitinophagales bacterium]|nr:MAG: hypothetical protein KatS3mg031_0199 [Chitinophagales bacterium]
MQQLLHDLESKTQRSETEQRDLRKLRVLLAMAHTGESDAASALLQLMPHILDVTPGGVIIWQHPVVQAVMAGDLAEEDLSADMAQQLQPVLSLLQQISDPAEPAPGDAYLDAWLQGLEEWEDLNEGLGKKPSKAERKARRKKRRAKVKKVFNKIGTALKKIDPLLGTARGSFLLILRFNWGALATKLYYLRENPAKKEAWKKIEKIWKGLGGGMKLLNKNINQGWKKKPVTQKKQDKWKHFLALIEKIPGKSNTAPTPPVAGLAAGLGAAPVAAALAAAASIIGAISGVLGKFLKKEDNSPPDKEDQAMMAKAAKDPAIIQAFKQVFPEAVTDRPAAAASADAQPADTTGSKDSASTVSRKWLPWLIGGAALATTGTAILITKKSKKKKAA